MAANIKGITIEIDGNVTPLQKALSSVNKSIKDTQRQLKDVNKLLKLDPKNTTLLKQKQELLAKQVDDVKEKLKKEKQALEQLKTADQTDEVKAKMAQLERQIIEDEQALKAATKELKNFGSIGKQQAKATAEAFKETGKKISEVGDKVNKVGQDLTTHVTAPIVAAGGAAIAAFNDVDAGYDVVIAKTGAAGEAAQEMYDIVDKLATTVPTDFETAGEAVGEVNTRFGLTGDSLYELSEQFVKFAELNNTDVTNSIDTVQKALSAFGLDAKDADRVLDVLNATGQATGASVDTLANGLVQNATAFQTLGLNVEQSTVLMGQMETSGANSETVMQGLRKALKNAAEDGVPLNKALEDLQDTIANGTDDMDGLTAAYEIFGKSGDQIYGAIKNGTLDFKALGEAASDTAGSVSDTFSETLDPIDQWKLTLNELKLAGAEVGSVVGEVLAPILKQVAEVVKDLKQKWDELDPSAQQAIITAAGIAATIGPIVAIIGSIISGIGGMITAIGVVAGALGVAASTVGIVIGVIVALGAVIVAVITHWDDLKKKVKEVWEGIKTYTTELKNNVVQGWNDLKTGVLNKIDALKATASNKWNAIKSDAVNKVTSMKTNIVNAFETIKEKASAFIEKIKGFFSNLVLKIPAPEMPKLPHFSLRTSTKTILGKEITYPSGIDVEWYAKAMKNPYLFTSPTMIGAGEAGHEMMYGHSSLMRDITEATAKNNAALINGFYNAMSAALSDTNLTVQIGRREFGRLVREAL